MPRIVYLLLATLPAAALVTVGRPWALLFLAPAVFGVWGIVVSGALLRLAYIGTGFSDPIAVVDAARDRVLSTGQSPYGVGFAETVPPGAPFAYGPLMLVNSVPLEIIAGIGILAVLAWYRRPFTLAVAAGLPFAISLTSSGNSDMLPTLLLAAGLLNLPRWPGGVLLGLSVVVKPYTAVFLPVAFANGSTATLAVAFATAGVGYLPALWWGGFLDSIAMLNAMQGSASPLRYLAAPLTLGAFRWPLLACVAFAAMTLTSEVWGLGYLVPLIVATGIVLEPANRFRHATRSNRR